MSDLSRFESLLVEKMPDLALKKDEPLSRHTSFSISGPAALLAQPKNAGELQQLQAPRLLKARSSAAGA